MYTKYLRLYLNESKIDEAIQLIQALKGVILAWPIEGLRTLRDAIGHPDATVHRAVVRVLAEAYNRHPRETVRFLRTSGSALGDDDLQQIKILQDPRIGRTQVAIHEWGRLAHYLVQEDGAAKRLATCARALLTVPDFTTAIRKIVSVLGLYDGTAR